MIETSTFAVSEGISLLHKLVLWSERLLEYFVFFREARKPTLLHLAVVEYIPTFAYILHAKLKSLRKTKKFLCPFIIETWTEYQETKNYTVSTSANGFEKNQ